MGESSDDANFKLKAGLFLAVSTGIGAAVGFVSTLASTRRSDVHAFEKGSIPHPSVRESGVSLALRALKWGTLLSVSGTGLIAFGVWKLSGATTLAEFRQKMGSILPRIPKNEKPVGRTEFSGLNDFLNYISTDYHEDAKKEKTVKR